MSDYSTLTLWLRMNTTLQWPLFDKQNSLIKHDSRLINRDSGPEVRDFICHYYKEYHLVHSPKNYQRTLDKMTAYMPNQLVEEKALLLHLGELLRQEKSSKFHPNN